MEMRRSLVYMLLGAGIGAGALATYQQYANGNLQHTIRKMRNDAQNQLEDMM